MRKKKIIGIIIGCIIVLTLIVLAAHFMHHKKATFNGSRVRGDSLYMIDFTILNGTQEHTMTFEKDDVIHCKWTIECGIVDIEIADSKGNKLYQGNKVTEAEFDLTVPRSGKYTVTVTGEDATGYISIGGIEK